MKIIKSSKEIKDLEQLAIIANIGCEICPECGNSCKPAPIKKNWYEPKKGCMKVTCYICENCGCEYESEPYQF